MELDSFDSCKVTVEGLEALLAVTMSMLFVAYNPALIHSIAQKAAVMNEGAIVGHGLDAEVLGDPKAGYTRRLLADSPTSRGAA